MKPEIFVVSLGPGNPELMTLECINKLFSAERIVLRTSKHPVSAWLEQHGKPWQSLDSFYDTSENFEQMHQAMATWLWKEASKSTLCFGVMTPQTDGAVLALKKTCPPEGKLHILAGVSQIDTCFAAVPENLEMGNPVRVFSATDLLTATPDPGISLLVTELDSKLLAGRVKLLLEEWYDEEMEICFFPSSNKRNTKPQKIPIYLLDCQKTYDHTVSAFVPGRNYLCRSRYSWQDLLQIVEKLRSPDGCPWDRIQTHESLRPFMVEEAWEAVNAIDEQNADHLSDELGDVLFQVFIHASIAQSFEEFTINDVVSKICKKMILRHPHVFDCQQHLSSPEALTANWEKIKREVIGNQSVGESLNDISKALPSLKYSMKMYKKLAQIPALCREPQLIASEIQLCAGHLMEGGCFSPDQMARLLLLCTELCFREDQDAEILLHQEVEQMRETIQLVEKKIQAEGKSPERMTPEQLCVYLQNDKKKKVLPVTLSSEEDCQYNSRNCDLKKK